MEARARPPLHLEIRDLLHGIVMHDVYHTAQIQLLKRLYRDA